MTRSGAETRRAVLPMAMPTSTLEERIRSLLGELESAGLKRSLEEPCGIDLCSNDYLGFARHPRIRARFARAVEALGAGSTGSRLLRGHRAAFQAIETRVAAWKRTPAALFFGSGWAANLGVLSTLTKPGDVIFSDQLNHASLIDGMRLSKARRVIFPHCDAEALEQLLEREPCDGQRFLVTESLFSMDGDLAPLERYAALQEHYGLALIVDEAHAVGTHGSTGSGAVEEAGCGDSVLLSVNSAGKALGVGGAFVCGPQWAVDYLVQAARPFVFSTAPPPAVAEAIDEALDLLAEEPARRARVRHLGGQLRAKLSIAGGDSPIVPVILGDVSEAVAVASRLREQGFDVRAIRPPTVPEGTARLRIALHADLGDEDIAQFASQLERILKGQDPCEASS